MNILLNFLIKHLRFEREVGRDSSKYENGNYYIELVKLKI